MSRNPVRIEPDPGARRRHPIGVALVMAATALALTGCSQVAQLRGVAGADVSAVRTATNSVLVDNEVPIGVAPVCTFADPAYVCTGSTMDDRPITSRAEVRAPFGATTDEWGAYAPADVTLVVAVDGREIFTGTVDEVLRRSGTVAR